MIQFYGYDKCSTCVKAKKFLSGRGKDFKFTDITVQPPSRTFLKAILDSGQYEMKSLFNTSGEVYRSMNMKEKVKTMTDTDILDLLASNGRLIKRPIVSDGKNHVVGFDETRLKDLK